mgnify:CR=1 FL=1
MIEMTKPDFLWQYIPEYHKVFQGDSLGGYEICGPTEEIRLLFAVSAVKEQQRSVLYVTETDEQAKKLRNAVRRFLSSEETGFYPARDLMPYESMAGNDSQKLDRIHVFEGLLSEKPFFAVVSRHTLSRRVIPPDIWKNATFTLRCGDVIDIADFAAKLVDMGYVRDVLTEERGTFSLRGSIVDVFPPSAVHPYRIDFFDDEIESIRCFEAETQVSLDDCDAAVICPGAAFFLPLSGQEKGVERIRLETEAMAQKLKGDKKQRCLGRTERLLDYLAQGTLPDVTEQLMSYFYPEAYLENYLPAGSMIIIEEAARIREGLDQDDQELAEIYRELYMEGEILPGYAEDFRKGEEVFAALNRFKLLSFSFLQQPTGLRTRVLDNVALREFSFYRPVEERLEELTELTAKGEVYLCAADEAGRKRMEGIKKSRELTRCEVVNFPLETSLEAYAIPAYYISERDLGGFARSAAPAPKRKKKKSNPIASFVDLKVGDYVVHETHGIGQYLGMERLNVGGTERDYLQIRYEGSDKLYIPTEQMDMLQRYIGNGELKPKVNRLGGKEWRATKEKVRGSVREMAQELIHLYAEREKQKGYAFSPDSDWQREMEAGFPYEETPDQLDAIRDIKADMERNRPMDRLLCGDVGYGKTEVALRAAFKAVLDGKQVAVLVPTTVLAQQHERTFRERLERFGVRVGGLSRFKTKKEADRVIDGLAAGEVDVVIGTHMLFNKRIFYKDLGLLIIDEEQRFGVTHKEKIKKLKQNIDVLAMSATPIPRTLHMSLVGVRDISIIETPPAFRQPVKTYVMEYQERLIKEAIEREIDRGGQIYYIHNRVDDMESVAGKLKELVPTAEILIGHGQMSETQLEQVMMDFMRREADILLCTTIVESGLDLPNVNTLILDNADRFGLSQMYQIRGRVGRSRRQAFAYFFYPKGKLLNTPAQKRLAAVRDYTDLGSGFKIAMRDMEIRGAGNILGAEQSGHMVSVGFEMYCRLIEEEVQRLSGKVVEKPREEVSISVLCSAYLPDDYVGDNDIKTAIYKKISEIRNGSEYKECLDELEDRFGSIPDPVYNLFLVIRLKLLAERLGLISAVQKKNEFVLTFEGVNDVDGDAVAALFKEFGRYFAFAMGEHLEITVRTGKLSPVKALMFTLKVMTFLVKRTQKKAPGEPTPSE